MNPDSTIYTANLRSAECTDRFIASALPSSEGYGEAGGYVFNFQFVYHGFRYVEITGLRNQPRPDDFTGLVSEYLRPATKKILFDE